MGLFDKLFQKKVCDICGGEIGLLGNRKLEDGNCCKECAKKLSYWFEDRRESSVAEIKEQLAYREANKEQVAKFHTTREMGNHMKVLVDEDAGVFMVTQFKEKDWPEANPDVIPASQLTGCEMEIKEMRSEIRREVRGKDGDIDRVSYFPPRYEYKYNFVIHIHLNNPYFDEIKFELPSFYVEVNTNLGWFGLNDGLPGCTMSPPVEVRRLDHEYARYEEMGNEIVSFMNQLRQGARAQAQAQPQMQNTAPQYAAQPQAAPVNNGMVTCPYCGAQTRAAKHCENCGAALQG